MCLTAYWPQNLRRLLLGVQAGNSNLPKVGYTLEMYPQMHYVNKGTKCILVRSHLTSFVYTKVLIEML